MATQPFPQAHFATFPPKLIEPCILAGTSAKGACPECGAPWTRITARVPVPDAIQRKGAGWDTSTGNGHHGAFHRDGREAEIVYAPVTESQTAGWQPSCTCHGHFVDVALEPVALAPDDDPPRDPDDALEDDEEPRFVSVYVPDSDAPEPVPCVVLDPFVGSGTSIMVAERNQRIGWGIDLKREYAGMASDRVAGDAGPMFCTVEVSEE